MKIAILDDYQDVVPHLSCYSLLAGHEVKIFHNTVKGSGQLAVRLADTEALVLIRERTRITKELLSKLPKLRLISQTGAAGRGSVSHIDLAECAARGIAVCESRGSPTPTAELTWALILAAMRRLPQYISNFKHGSWQHSGMKTALAPPNHGVGDALAGKTLGIWGYGRIGRIVAGYGAAFGMNVLVWGREKSQQAARENSFEVASDKSDLFLRADVLSLHLRLTEDTRGIVQPGDLKAMKPTALFVNTSRAELVVPDALVAALHSGRPGLAAVDVFESEPLLAGHPLLLMENVICTPHLGYVEKDNYEKMFGMAFRNILAFAAGAPENLVAAEAVAGAER